jgi:hypothetical protein
MSHLKKNGAVRFELEEIWRWYWIVGGFMIKELHGCSP